MTAGIKVYQLHNQRHMLARWAGVLAIQNYEPWQHTCRARERARNRKVILVIEHYVLEPDRDAGSRSIMAIIESLLSSGWIVKFWPLNRAYSTVYTTAMERRGIEVIDGRCGDDLQRWLEINGRDLDHILVTRPTAAVEVLPCLLTQAAVPLSFYGGDLHFARVGRQARLQGDTDLMREAERLQRLENRLWRNFDLVLYPSEEEVAVVRRMSPGTLARSIIPFVSEAHPPRAAVTDGRSILFVAGFARPPNVDAASFLLAEVIPLLEVSVGPVTVTLAGSNPTEAVRRLAGRDVRVTGHVSEEELKALYYCHRVSIVPLRFGAGVKGKVVESLSHGLPFVTTSIGAQGIEGLGEVVPVHDDPVRIAAALAVLLSDDATWLRQSHAQTAFATAMFSREAVRASVMSSFAALEDSVGGAAATAGEQASSPASNNVDRRLLERI